MNAAGPLEVTPSAIELPGTVSVDITAWLAACGQNGPAVASPNDRTG